MGVWAVAWLLALVGVVVVDGGSSGGQALASEASSTRRSTTATPSGSVPGPVTVVQAYPGGGSGEVVLDWDAVAGATGYRVLRARCPGGRFRRVADIDITTGRATAAPDVVNIWSAQHSYIPSGGTLPAPDSSPWFQYVDVGWSGQRCYRVVAYNAAGAAPPSVVTCASPPGG